MYKNGDRIFMPMKCDYATQKCKTVFCDGKTGIMRPLAASSDLCRGSNDETIVDSTKQQKKDGKSFIFVVVVSF
jgi:hypothetical protein